MFLWIGAGAQRSFVTAAPYTIAITQPDGTKLNIRGMGDENRHLTVTSDGYTVLKNSKGFYEFVRLSEDDKLVIFRESVHTMLQSAVLKKKVILNLLESF